MAPKLGIVAGSGDFPLRLAHACRSTGREPFVLALEGQADPADFAGFATATVRIGAAGRALNLLRRSRVSELAFAGNVSRPPLRSIHPDRRASVFLGKLALRSLGDDGLLRAVARELEAEGFRIISPASILQDATIPVGPCGEYLPDREACADIARGIEVAAALGRADAGQAVVVQQGVVLAIEAAEGTDALIGRAGAIQRKGGGGVLVKMAKPQQDRRLDPPVIGPTTVRNVASAGLRGIAVESGGVLVLDRKLVVEEADAAGLFLVGVESARET